MTKHALADRRIRIWLLAAAAFTMILFLVPSRASAAQGDCAQPASTGSGPTASDCLFILGVVVGSQTCDPSCICAPGGSLPPSATDALVCLRRAVGQQVELNCPCTSGTSVTTVTTTVTTTTSTSSTVTTVPGGFTCGDAASPLCDGDCPPGSACLTFAQGVPCSCVPFDCGALAPAPTCFGLCPDNQVCISQGETCTCASTVQDQCSDQLVPLTCDGQCPPGSFCSVTNPIAAECECIAIACGQNQFGPPTCYGECPQGMACVDIDNNCNCMPIP